MTSVPLLLHETIRELHTLHEYTQLDDVENFSSLLRSTVLNISRLLSLNANHNSLKLSSTAFDLVSLLHFSNSAPAPQNDFTYANIFLFIKDDSVTSESSSTLFTQLLQLLAETHHSDRRPARVRLSYSQIISRFSDLVLFFLSLHKLSEQTLVDYIARCFMYEFSYFSGLGSQIDNSGSHSNTEHMVKALDKFILSSADGLAAPEIDSIFSYDASSPSHEALNFQCSDENFTRLYHIFLQLSLFKSPTAFQENVVPYIEVMINFFKRLCSIDHFEVDDFETQEQKFNTLYAFFVGNDEGDGILPASVHDLAVKIIDEIIDAPTPSSPNYNIIKGETENNSLTRINTLLSRGYARDEIIDLISNLETVISILKEYDLDFDFTFPSTFHHYLFLVYEELPELAIDADYEFIDVIDETIGAIIDFESHEDSENEEIRGIVAQLHELQYVFTVVNELLTLLMRTAIKEIAHINSFTKALLRRWNHRTMAIAQLEVIRTDVFTIDSDAIVLKKLFLAWYESTMKFKHLHVQAAKYSDKKALASHLNSFWIRKIIVLAEAASKVENLRAGYILSHWKKRLHNISIMFQKLDEFHDSKSLAATFTRVLIRSRELQDLTEKAETMRTQFQSAGDRGLLLVSFLLWKSKFIGSFTHSGVDYTFQKLAKLSELERYYLMKRSFAILTTKSKVQKSFKQITNIRIDNLRAKILHHWKQKLMMLGMEESFGNQRDSTLKLAILRHWDESSKLRKKADNLCHASLLRRSLRSWRLITLRRQFQKELDSLLLKKLFKNVLLERQRKAMTQSKASELVLSTISVWKRRMAESEGQTALASKTREHSLENWALSIWASKLALNEELVVVADLNLQRKFLMKARGVYLRLQEALFGTTKLLGEKFDHRLLLKASLRNWKEIYIEHHERQCLQAAKSFQANVADRGHVAVFFQHWRREAAALKLKKMRLENQLAAFQDTCTLKRDVFGRWISMGESHREAAFRSIEFYDALLKKRIMLVWYEKYVLKVTYLSELADEIINKKDYSRLVEILRKWNLRYLKNVRLSQQTCEMFIEKWEKAKFRSLFEVWLHKSTQRSRNDIYEEANSTFGSNTSPLARKSEKPSPGSSALVTTSYFNTPIKKQVASPYTPSGQRTSPTKFQETNQRMKSDRMDALISRYRLAKNKKGKYPLREGTWPRLSPPKRFSLPMNVQSRPPPAPRFDNSSRSPSPAATSSPSVEPTAYERFASYSSDNEDLDVSLIDTAKKLQKIKPIVVPQEEGDYSSIKYSSISKLKERLVSKAGSPIRASYG